MVLEHWISMRLGAGAGGCGAGNEPYPKPHASHENYLKTDHRSNIKYKTTKLLEENTERFVWETGVG